MGGAAAKPVAVPVAGPAPRRGKVPFEIGYSQVDWIQLTRSDADLAGLRSAGGQAAAARPLAVPAAEGHGASGCQLVFGYRPTHADAPELGLPLLRRRPGRGAPPEEHHAGGGGSAQDRRRRLDGAAGQGTSRGAQVLYIEGRG